MHELIYKHFDQLADCDVKGNDSTVALWTVDNFLPSSVYTQVVEEVEDIPATDWRTYHADTHSRSECTDWRTAPITRTLQQSMCSSQFTNWITSITGHQGLVSDPQSHAAGLTYISEGGHIARHKDFNWNEQLRMNRKVNVILYTTRTWQPQWAGNLNFYNDGQPVLTVEPMPNRLVIWRYDVDLVHGVDTVRSPQHVMRTNLMNWYYQSNGTWEHEPQRTTYA